MRISHNIYGVQQYCTWHCIFVGHHIYVDFILSLDLFVVFHAMVMTFTSAHSICKMPLHVWHATYKYKESHFNIVESNALAMHYMF
jgi:hypothetical protein